MASGSRSLPSERSVLTVTSKAISAASSRLSTSDEAVRWASRVARRSIVARRCGSSRPSVCLVDPPENTFRQIGRISAVEGRTPSAVARKIEIELSEEERS